MTWKGPGFGQTRAYYVWRAIGSFTSISSVTTNINLFTKIATVTNSVPNTAPPLQYLDSQVKVPNTYTYFVTDANKEGAASGPSNPVAVTLKSSSGHDDH